MKQIRIQKPRGSGKPDNEISDIPTKAVSNTGPAREILAKIDKALEEK